MSNRSWSCGVALLLAAAGAAAACQSAGGFSCNDNDDCQAGDLDGTCELNGLCSFPDQDCESGQRYGQASGALAGDCVPPTSDGTGGETEDVPSGETTEAPLTSTTLPGTSTQPPGTESSGSADTGTASGSQCGNGDIDDAEVCDDGVNDGSYEGCSADCQSRGPFCGDGVRNGDELCDDANDQNGDGCNTDCIESGSRIWVADEPPGLNDGRDVDVGAEDVVYVTALQNNIGSPTQQDVFVGAVDANGETIWQDVWDSGMEFDSPAGLVVDETGQINVVGGSTVGQADAPFLRVYNDDGNAAGNVTGLADIGQNLFGFAVASRGEVVAAVGGSVGADFTMSIGRAWGISESLSVDWQTDLIGHGAVRPVAAAYAPNGDLLIAAHGGTSFGEAAFVFRLNVVGSLTFSWDLQWPAEASRRVPTGIAVESGGDIYVSGYLDDRSVHGYIHRMSGAGETIWTDELSANSTHLFDVAIDSENRVIVVGSVRQGVSGNDYDGLIRKYDTDGGVMWSLEHDSTQVQNGTDSFFAVAIDSTDHIIVTGSEDHTNFGDPLTVYLAKYAP